MKTLLPLALLALSCSSTGASICNALTCATGCCDESGTCRPGTAASACGKNGDSCESCLGCLGQVCSNPVGTGGGGSAGGAATGGGSSSSGGGSTAAGGGVGPAADAVVNEIVARGGDEFVELYNPGALGRDLSGVIVTDSESDGGPSLGHGVSLGSGTILAGHSFLLIRCGQADAGLSTDCNGAPVSSCVLATWSVSNGNGETVWLLNPDNSVMHSTVYPPNGHDTGKSYGRLPDGTGAFTQTTPTPGAANAQ